MEREIRRIPQLAGILALALMATLPAVGGAREAQKAAATPAAKAAPAAAAKAGANPCPYPVHCKAGQDCHNYPYKPTDCWTTQYGPAKADVIIATDKAGAVDSPNMLYCDGNTYALCFFSGPSTPTGKPNSGNKALPCVLNEHGDLASCTCQAYTSGPNFVDINGILNQGTYFETVEICGKDGSRCRNIVNCGPRGDKAGCTDHLTAPVCRYVKNQSPTHPQGSLMPKADLISTFSFAMSGPDGTYQLGSIPCTGLYVGCMTAACTYGPNHTSPTQKGEPVTCQCPTYKGPYQIGQSGQTCPAAGDTSHPWSASFTVSSSGK